MALIHPAYLRSEQKRLWEYSFFEACPHYIKSGLVNDAELERLSTELTGVTTEETIGVAQARMPVTWARKPI